MPIIGGATPARIGSPRVGPAGSRVSRRTLQVRYLVSASNSTLNQSRCRSVVMVPVTEPPTSTSPVVVVSAGRSVPPSETFARVPGPGAWHGPGRAPAPNHPGRTRSSTGPASASGVTSVTAESVAAYLVPVPRHPRVVGSTLRRRKRHTAVSAPPEIVVVASRLVTPLAVVDRPEIGVRKRSAPAGAALEIKPVGPPPFKLHREPVLIVGNLDRARDRTARHRPGRWLCCR